MAEKKKWKKWVDGYRVFTPTLLPFVKAVIASPLDETLRLAMADFLQEMDMPRVEAAAAHFRKDGERTIGKYFAKEDVGRRTTLLGLGWLVSTPEEVKRIVIADLRLRTMPMCMSRRNSTCRKFRLKRMSYRHLHPDAAGNWTCPDCRFRN